MATARKKTGIAGELEMKPPLEMKPLLVDIEMDSQDNAAATPTSTSTKGAITAMGLKVLMLLAAQNSFKNILMRYVMKDQPEFLLSTAVIVVEALKFIFAAAYIVFVQKQSLHSIFIFMFKKDWKNTLRLVVPASAYSLQMTLEYVALGNIDPASFSVIVQIKMLTTAFFFRTVLKRRLMKKQLMSLVLLTVGVMLCSMRVGNDDSELSGQRLVGILATLGIACSSGFASVYTEKVIKGAKKNNPDNLEKEYGLAHVQAQLAFVALIILGLYSGIRDIHVIKEKGFFHNYNAAAFCSSLNSAVGGLIVAAVLKHADSVLKGYATAVSVVLTGAASYVMFGTHLSMFYGMGIINVLTAVLLYNSSNMDDYLC